jgi:ribosome-binding protein aMBF1 (putative translation factor)
MRSLVDLVAEPVDLWCPHYLQVIVSRSNVDGLGSDRGQKGTTTMPATDSRKVRSVERPRQDGRASNIAAASRVEGRSSSRKPGRVPVVSAKSSMARSVPSAKRTSNGRSGSDLASRVLNATPAETLVRLTPGQMVRIAREFAELSQTELADLAGLTQATVSAIETGKTNLGAVRAKRLAEAMKIHPAALLFPG